MDPNNGLIVHVSIGTPPDEFDAVRAEAEHFREALTIHARSTFGDHASVTVAVHSYDAYMPEPESVEINPSQGKLP